VLTFYRGPELLITIDAVEIRRRGEPARRFSLKELEDIHISINRPRVLGPRVYEVSSTYRGAQVTLFRTTDRTSFGLVRRALIRAMEEEARALDVANDRISEGTSEWKRRWRGRVALASGESSSSERDPWHDLAKGISAGDPDPAVAPLPQWQRAGQGEPRWRVYLQRLLSLPLTRSGAMTVAIDNFDRRMTSALAKLGDPADVNRGGRR
jgi:hypothetical protein